MPTALDISLPPRFRLAYAVCSYGYFILAPNVWRPAPRGPRGELHRPLRDLDRRVVRAVISQPSPRALRVALHRKVGSRHHDHLVAQVGRMLRLNESFTRWRKLHPVAARGGFDRTFRSPTLFEDLVKTITGCNVSWPNTIRMNRLLCEHIGAAGDFPTPDELAAVTPERLARLCKVGYRAQRIVRLARDVTRGRLDLDWFEQPQRTTDELYDALMNLYGFGEYATNNALQLLGRYDRLPVDSETLRHFRQSHKVEGDLKHVTAAAHRHYAQFAPYQFLAYWYELWGDYESRFGDAHRWPAEVHTQFTASQLK